MIEDFDKLNDQRSCLLREQKVQFFFGKKIAEAVILVVVAWFLVLRPGVPRGCPLRLPNSKMINRKNGVLIFLCRLVMMPVVLVHFIRRIAAAQDT